MNVLSLFDGMSCGRIALDRAGIKVDQYYASELDKYATTVTQANWPETIQLGDVTNWREWGLDWSSIDLLIGGSPCQGFSFAGKQLAFDDPRSKLFFVYVDILNHIRSVNPNVKFMLENVRMKKEHLAVISEQLGVEPVFINSALVSAQNRQRYYWANWEIKQPDDKGIVLADILEGGEVDRDKAFCIDANYHKGGNPEQYFTKNRRQLVFKPAAIVGRKLDENGNRNDTPEQKPVQCLEVQPHGKSRFLSTVAKDTVISPLEPRRYPLKIRDKSKCLRSSGRGSYDRHEWDSISDCHYRKLTPIECERLQTVLQYIKPVEIVLCYDQAKSFVGAVEKNHKLLKLVSSAGNEELKECVKRASQIMSANQAPTKHTARQNADMQTRKQTEKCTRTNQEERILIADSAEDATTFNQAESEVSSATQSAFINITEGRITHCGKVESHRIEQNYTELMSGKIALRPCGGEMMQNAKDAMSVLEAMQINQYSTSITSFRLSTKNIEQTLIISYWFAKSAIDGFTQDTTNKKSLYLNLIDGYTAHVSNTQRYKMLGNGFTVDVIAHIFKSMIIDKN